MYCTENIFLCLSHERNDGRGGKTDGAAKMCPLHISTQAEYIHRCSTPTRPTTTVDRKIVRQGTKNKRNDSTFPLLQFTLHSIFLKHCAAELDSHKLSAATIVHHY